MVKKEKNIITGIDIGTKEIKLVVAEKKKDSVIILDLKKTASKGIRKGKIVDSPPVVESIRKVLDESERNLGFPIESAYVAYGGHFIKEYERKVELNLDSKRRRIVFSDIKEAMNLALEDVESIGNVIHAFSIDYGVDNEWGIENPIGREASLLKMHLFVLEGNKEEIEIASSCAERAGLKVKGIFHKSVISPFGCFSSKPDELVLYVDLGAGTTTASLLKGTKVLNVDIYPVGGSHITSDLSYILRIPLEKSEALKKIVSINEPEENLDDELEFEVNGEKIVCRVGDVVEIIKHRIEELFIDLILNDLQRKKSLDYPSFSKIVISGGVSKMQGLPTFIQNLCGIPVEIGLPALDMPENERGSDNVSIAGLINYTIFKEAHPYAILNSCIGGGAISFDEEDPVFNSSIAEKVRKAKQKRFKGQQVKKVIATFKKVIKELF
ncbi:cell division protein FtsA [Thermovirga sp.]|uniref:cell division protein FtsA n=1 Tax=Thermovirga sp. TaxID=2699834 RepID=UPI0025E75B3D|nr:cell division protein FtsA [Thermovirga sp.]MBO8153106.1 cell division protein FtsA [Thermovirga sp.]